ASYRFALRAVEARRKEKIWFGTTKRISTNNNQQQASTDALSEEAFPYEITCMVFLEKTWKERISSHFSGDLLYRLDERNAEQVAPVLQEVLDGLRSSPGVPGRDRADEEAGTQIARLLAWTTWFPQARVRAYTWSIPDVQEDNVSY